MLLQSVYKYEGALKAVPPILLFWPMKSKADVSGMVGGVLNIPFHVVAM